MYVTVFSILCPLSSFSFFLVCLVAIIFHSDVVLETRVLVSRRLEDKNESLGLGLEHLILVLVSVLKKKSCSFSRLLL